jgi:hypothetical protein
MGIVGRFTRDEVSAKVWWPFALLLLVLLVLTFPGESRAVDLAQDGFADGGDTLVDKGVDIAQWEWLGYRIAVAAGLLVTLSLALLSIRESKARIGAGVPFYPENVPPYLALIDADEAEQLRELGSYARRRVGDLQERIASMEEEKLSLEGEVQRLLSDAAERGLIPVAEAEAAQDLVVIPEAGGEDVVALPATEAGGESIVATHPDNTGPPPADEKPAEMLARMVEPIAPVPASEADQADLRSRLERTAALKKPGSKERREERERDEGPYFPSGI